MACARAAPPSWATAAAPCTRLRPSPGHRTLKEVQRYTEAYDRKQAAVRAQAKVANAGNVVPLKVAAER